MNGRRFNLPCVDCRKTVERSANFGKVRCYDCKLKRNRQQSAKWRKDKPKTGWATVKAESAAAVKKRIQALLREIAVKRDGGCVLRHFPEAGSCSGYAPKSGHLILQAEHLVSRGKSVSYGDMRNIVCLCRHHHGHFKPEQPVLYWKLIRQVIGETRWKWVERVATDNRAYPMSKSDWLMVELALTKELQQYSNDQDT